MTGCGRDLERASVVACVVVAAGKGERFGHGGKVLAACAGHPLLAWSLDALETASSVRDVVVVFGNHTEDEVRTLIVGGRWTKVAAIVPGGANRHASVRAGIDALAPDVEVVLVHDAARPLAEPVHFDAVAGVAGDSGAAILATPVADTLKRVTEGTIEATVPRVGMWAAQTPQGFRLAEYREALARTTGHEDEFTDDASMFEVLGWPVRIVPGSRSNLKVTVPEDLVLVEALLKTRRVEESR
ncbi:MAG: 2-C-methyl-D-erythritol 4-phosphate cytidylyltransferase [Thermomicrobiales bacterium]